MSGTNPRDRKIKVMYIVTRLNIGGVAPHVILLASGLNLREFEVIVLAGPEPAEEGSMELLAKQKSVKLIRIPYLQRNISLVRDAKAFWRIYQLIRNHTPDIVHTHTSKAGILGRFAAKLAGVKYTVHTFHGHIFEGYFSRSKTKLFLLLERLWALYTTRILVVNQLIQDDLRSLGVGNGRCEVIENGFDLENLVRVQRFEGSFRREIGVHPKHVLVGAVGRLVPIKGCAYLLKACADLLKSMPSTKLAFVGDGELREELKAEAALHGIENQVIFTGFRQDMENVYSDLNLLVIPSLNEGLPTVLIEALCAGVPVVATRVGAIPDLVDENSGIIVEPKDTKALSSAIRQMLQDPFRSLTNDVRKKNYERFSSKRFIKDMEKFYMDISSNNS